MNKHAKQAEIDFINVLNILKEAREEYLQKEYKTLSDTLHYHLSLHIRHLDSNPKVYHAGKYVAYEVSDDTKCFYKKAKELLTIEVEELNNIKLLFLDIKSARKYREWTLSYERVLSALSRIEELDEETFTSE